METKKPSQANPLAQAVDEAVSACVTDKLAIALSPILASIEKVRGFSEVSAKGVGMAIDQSKKADEIPTLAKKTDLPDIDALHMEVKGNAAKLEKVKNDTALIPLLIKPD